MSGHEERRESRNEGDSFSSEQETHVDPVCGMKVASDEAANSFKYDGKTWYFCCEHCLEKFKENPERFLEELKIT